MPTNALRVALTAEQIMEANRRAEFFVNRVQGSASMWKHNRGGAPREREAMLANDVLGQLGQCVIACVFDLPWQHEVNGFKLPDVGPLWVRSTNLVNGSLILRTHDTADDDPWVLAYVAPDYSYGLACGWILGREAKRPLYWRSDVRSPAWFVPRGSLRAFTDPMFTKWVRWPAPTQTALFTESS